ncbi:MAG: hypothetical protein M1818_004336 [Claussenomyces sp. TS43310]|nr:MAG: hypothetical protein M1818_004336 [Claussenomyces sp. TS43310]
MSGHQDNNMGRRRPHHVPAKASDPPLSAATSALDDPLSSLLNPKTRASVSSSIDKDVPLNAQVHDTLTSKTGDMALSDFSHKSQWIILAVASGACAAFNGVFAKLTTNELTTTLASAIARFLGLGDGETVVEYIIRLMFLILNFIFNGVMWALFTKALARGTSTTQVSVINTSSNFMITALLGFFIFTESLPAQWWVGAALLVAGNVIIGRREEKETGVSSDVHRSAENGEGSYSEEETLLGDDLELVDDLEVVLKRRHESDDILDLDLDESATTSK